MLVLYDERVDAKIAEIEVPELPEATNLPTVMHLDIKNTNVEPTECPDGWTELSLNRLWDTDDTNFRRTCITDQKCEVLHLDDRNIPVECPENWTQADYGGLDRKNYRRTCYICE